MEIHDNTSEHDTEPDAVFLESIQGLTKEQIDAVLSNENGTRGPGTSTDSDNARVESIMNDHDEFDLQDFEKKGSLNAGEINTLKKLAGDNLAELVSGDLEDHVAYHEKMRAIDSLGKQSGTMYRDIIFSLIQIRLPEAEARRDWKEILAHKYTVSEKLGRNIGIHVATLDYYANIKQTKFNPTIVDANEYADTASKAIFDDLTKAYNRSFFDQEFRRRFMRSRVTGVYFSFAMLDLDHFKEYNDRNGHIQGDIALIESVRILHTVCCWRDIVARYGGEEFAIVLHGQPIDVAMRTAEKIRQAIYDYRFVNEQVLPYGRLSASIGVTTYRDDIATPLEMIEEADVALYRAKNAGRNTVKAFLKPDLKSESHE